MSFFYITSHVSHPGPSISVLEPNISQADMHQLRTNIGCSEKKCHVTIYMYKGNFFQKILYLSQVNGRKHLVIYNLFRIYCRYIYVLVSSTLLYTAYTNIFTPYLLEIHIVFSKGYLKQTCQIFFNMGVEKKNIK